MLETFIRLQCCMPAFLRAKKKDCRGSLCLPTPFVRKRYLGIIVATTQRKRFNKHLVHRIRAVNSRIVGHAYSFHSDMQKTYISRAFVCMFECLCMNFEELENLCVDLEGIDTQIQQKIKQISDLEEKAKQLKEENELERMIAEVRGEKPPAGHGLEELGQAKEELKSLKSNLEELRKKALKGMAKLDLPISKPEIDSEGNVVMTLEGGPYEKAVKFVADKFDSSVPLDLDGVLLDPNKIVVTKAGDQKKGVQKLFVFKNNIHRMARVAMGEDDPEIKRVIEYMRKGTYTDIWEAVGSKQKVVFENLYRDLGITESSGKKRVRNFFTNSQRALGEVFPFINIGPGVWERTFFGSLVWRRYQTLHPSVKETEEVLKEAEEESEGEAEVRTRKTEPEFQPLNKYMETKELDKILYGNTGDEDANSR